MRSDPPTAGDGKSDVTGIAAATNELVVYRTGAIRGDSGTNVLAYVVEVTNKANVRDTVFVDARSGKALNRYSMIDDALDREVYEAGGTAEAPTFTLVWEEGDPFPGGLNEDQRNLVEGTGDSYWLMANAFGRDSFDGEGGTMITVNNDPRINCPNANWNGVTTNYCTGVTCDDTVAHEWGHALTTTPPT